MVSEQMVNGTDVQAIQIHCATGPSPKAGGESSRAWLYGKLFVALLTEKLITHASSLFHWGYILEEPSVPERAA